MKKGFTLIELLVVLAIIGILAAMIIASLSGARARARDATRKSDLRQVKTALEQYYSDKDQQYPAGSALNVETGLFGTGNPLDGYMKAVKDPKNTSPYIYLYTATGTPPDNYVLYVPIENKGEADTSGITCLGAGGGTGVCTSGGTKYFQTTND